MSKGKTSSGLSAEMAAFIRREVLGHPNEPKPFQKDNVGYKKPPKSGQFQKGQSGNPNGRPKAAPQLTATTEAILATADKSIITQGPDGTEQITLREALVRKAMEAALKGNAHAQKTVLAEIHRAEAIKAERIKAEVENWTAYCREGRRRLAESQEREGEAPTLIPHPDDIVIDEAEGVSFTGPATLEEYAECLFTMRERNALILQDALDRRQEVIPRYPQSQSEHGIAFLTAMTCHRRLPVRLQIHEELRDRIDDARSMTKRDLLRETKDAWMAAGFKLPRGFTMAMPEDTQHIMPAIEQLFDELDPKTVTEDDILMALKRMFNGLGVKVA